MKVRFKSKVTKGFSFSPLRGSLTQGKFKKNLWDQGILDIEKYVNVMGAHSTNAVLLPGMHTHPSIVPLCGFNRMPEFDLRFYEDLHLYVRDC